MTYNKNQNKAAGKNERANAGKLSFGLLYEEKRDQLETQLPSTFKYSREATLQIAKVNRDLFTDINEKKSGNYIVSGLPRTISPLDFEAFCMAAGQLLYNQSYQFGHSKNNSGMGERIAENMSRRTGQRIYMGEIGASLNEICRLGYGREPSHRQKEAMAKLIDTLHKTTVKIAYPNGDTSEHVLSAVMDIYHRKKDGATIYHLYLNPIFTMMARGYAVFPQDITKRLSDSVKRMTAQHYKLMKLLSIQDKRKPYPRMIDGLLFDLDMEQTYRKDPSRTEKQLLSLFEDMKKVSVIKDFKVNRQKFRKRMAINKVTFFFDPDAAEAPEPQDKAGSQSSDNGSAAQANGTAEQPQP